MKNFAVFLLFIAIAASVAGCNQQREALMADDSSNAPASIELARHDTTEHVESATHGDHKRHGTHHHAFANPEELAKKWNDPQRDKWQHPQQIVEAMSLQSGATVADIGAGTGYMVVHLSQTVGKDGTVIAIDAESAMIDYLNKHKSEFGPAKILPQKVGFSDPELPSASMDAVLMLDAWHHVAGREEYAKKVFAGLKRGGKFVVVDYAVDAEVGPPTEMRLTAEQVKKHLEPSGFRVKIIRESLPRHYIVVGIKD